ncbi:uncharacterized protein MYCFIDRAFT_98841, partial [Pseudocercospora fijiensis CIRAD86]
AAAFPWVAHSVGMSKRDFDGESLTRDVERRDDQQTCGFNPNHVPAQGITTQYPYCGAKYPLPGTQVCTNNLVPAKGDTAHAYMKPKSTDIRGPCPGLNTAANHNFLARDGITTFGELVDAQQNVYGVGYDLAVLLATLGVGLDGDPVTMKLSLGCDATTRTATPGLGPEPGLNGHNKFEGDTSLTRNDYFLNNGDNYKFNTTLYNQMIQQCSVGGVNTAGCNEANIARYRKQRYDDSVAHNGNFYYGPKSLLLYGAASFLYELFPSKGELGTPDKQTMDYFFKNEQLPQNWFSRVDPYSIPLVAAEIFKQYEAYPVAFGGNTGKPNSFVGLGQFGPSISNNMFNGTAAGVACLLYQIATENVPSALGGGGNTAFTTVPQANLDFMRKMVNPIFASSNMTAFAACPIVAPSGTGGNG